MRVKVYIGDSIFLEEGMFGSVNEDHDKIVNEKNNDVNEENSKTHDKFVCDKRGVTWGVVDEEGEDGFEEFGENGEVRDEEDVTDVFADS
jgi:hypothetical protein